MQVSLVMRPISVDKVNGALVGIEKVASKDEEEGAAHDQVHVEEEEEEE